MVVLPSDEAIPVVFHVAAADLVDSDTLVVEVAAAVVWVLAVIFCCCCFFRLKTLTQKTI